MFQSKVQSKLSISWMVIHNRLWSSSPKKIEYKIKNPKVNPTHPLKGCI